MPGLGTELRPCGEQQQALTTAESSSWPLLFTSSRGSAREKKKIIIADEHTSFLHVLCPDFGFGTNYEESQNYPSCRCARISFSLLCLKMKENMGLFTGFSDKVLFYLSCSPVEEPRSGCHKLMAVDLILWLVGKCIFFPPLRSLHQSVSMQLIKSMGKAKGRLEQDWTSFTARSS